MEEHEKYKREHLSYITELRRVAVSVTNFIEVFLVRTGICILVSTCFNCIQCPIFAGTGHEELRNIFYYLVVMGNLRDWVFSFGTFCWPTSLIRASI